MNEEHALARVGKLTASRFQDAMARSKNGWGASRERYIGELVTERLTGEPYPHYTSYEMQRGIEVEPLARAAYSFMRDVDVVPTGFVNHPTIAMSGCSPDGFVGDDGLVEFKCPSTHTHIATLRGATIDLAYLAQMHWQMICTGRRWCDWVSFDPRLPAHLQLYIERIETSDGVREKMENDARVFLNEVDRCMEALARRAA